MRTTRLLICLAVAAVWPAAAQRWVTLFDGRNLDQWQKGASGWTVEGGVLALANSTDGKEHNDNYLWTAAQYGDFVLELEFKVPPAQANSGVFLRTSDTKDPVQTGIEVQVSNPRPDGMLTRNGAGSIYDLVAPTTLPFRQNDWNRYAITCRGATIQVELNGTRITEANLERWTKTGLNPDGSKNKFTQPLKEFAREGYIGLQDHGRPVWYRSIRIRPLGK